MKKPRYRIQLDDKLLPVQAFLNIWNDDEFLTTISEVINGVLNGSKAYYGFDYNGTGCLLPHLENPEVPKNEIIFYVPYEEISLPFNQVFDVFNSAVNEYLKTNPNDLARAQKVIELAKSALLNNDR